MGRANVVLMGLCLFWGRTRVLTTLHLGGCTPVPAALCLTETS